MCYTPLVRVYKLCYMYLVSILPILIKSLEGFQVETPAGTLTCKSAMLMCTLDLPARAIDTNMKFNGHFSCSWCAIKGENPPGLPMVTYFPLPLLEPIRRTQHMFLADAHEATSTDSAVSLS